ncbi:MAG: TatD family hydrolase [Patescibacteria group bacterium]
MIFDTHSHLYFDQLVPREEEIIANMKTLGVTHSVQIGCDIASSISAINLAKKYPNFYATVGFHPVDAQDPSTRKTRSSASGNELPETREGIIATMRDLIETNRKHVVAIGETGLDYHYLESDKTDTQKSEQYFWFETQARLAKEYNLPLVIHSRDASADTIKYLKLYGVTHCVIHCFSENWEFAKELLEYSDDIYFSFSGILTYKNAPDIQEAARNIPLDRILIETDAPFLTPVPKR